MSKYKQFFTNHALLKERCVEICRLFHKHDPDLYPDILEEDLLFVFDERQNFCKKLFEFSTRILEKQQYRLIRLKLFKSLKN